MFKLIAKKLTRNGLVSIEQLFLEGEKEIAIAVAATLDATEGFSEVRLLDYVQARGKVTTILPTIKDGAFETKVNLKTAVKFSWVKFQKPKAKSKAKPKKIAASADAFDLPAKPKRVSKRQRAFGVEADKTLVTAE